VEKTPSTGWPTWDNTTCRWTSTRCTKVRKQANHYLTGRDGGRDIDLRKFAWRAYNCMAA
jgi:hypothetical protein